jgi:hypothetical protein
MLNNKKNEVDQSHITGKWWEVGFFAAETLLNIYIGKNKWSKLCSIITNNEFYFISSQRDILHLPRDLLKNTISL